MNIDLLIIIADTYRTIKALEAEAEDLAARLASTSTELAARRATYDRALADLGATASTDPTDTPITGTRYTRRVYPDGRRALLDDRGATALSFPWSRPASIVARLYDALETPMTRPQIEAWAASNKILIATATGYLPQLAMMGLIIGDGLTWRRA